MLEDDVSDAIHRIGNNIRDDLQRQFGGIQGTCAVASWMLTRKLREMGLDPVFVHGGYQPDPSCPSALGRTYTQHSHVWVRLGEHIIDLTADQFNKIAESVQPPVLVGEAPILEYQEWRCGDAAHEIVTRQLLCCAKDVELDAWERDVYAVMLGILTQAEGSVGAVSSAESLRGG